jgi:hypothetical protein
MSSCLRVTPGETRHLLRVTAGVTADQVTTLLQFANLSPIQITAAADQIGSHEEAAPAQFLQFGGNAIKGADPAVVDGQKDGAGLVRSDLVHAVDSLRARA